MKKRIMLVLCVLIVLCSCVSPAYAAMKKEEVGSLVSLYYENHQLRHEKDVLFPPADTVPYIEFVFVKDSPPSIINCNEYRIYESRKLPTSWTDVSSAFMELLMLAMEVTEQHPAVQAVDLERIASTYAYDINLEFPDTKWWHSGVTDTYSLYAGPVLLTDRDKNVIDDHVYFFSIFVKDDMISYWLCADEDIVYRMISALEPPAASGTYDKYLLNWLEENRSRYGSDNEANTWLVDESGFVQVDGTITITHARKVKLRAADYTSAPVVVEAQPGESFHTSAITDNGWYQVQLEDGGTAYISPNVVEFTAE